MDPLLAPLERAKTYELVVQRVHDEIVAGRIKPGDRLPGERQLSETLQVSRASVREAVRVLQAQQIVRTRPGTGPESGLIVAVNPRRALSELLRLHVALSAYQVADVLGVRLALEEQAVRRLAARAAQTDFGPVEAVLEQMSAPGIDPYTFHALDTDFHLELARAAENHLLEDLMQALRDAVRRSMLDAFEQKEDWPAFRCDLVAEHRLILTAARSGDPEKAAELMRQHVDGFYDVLHAERPTGASGAGES
ncbi:FadR/GntR family transcriptional regulator [Micromonospora sp. NPDC005161]